MSSDSSSKSAEVPDVDCDVPVSELARRDLLPANLRRFDSTASACESRERFEPGDVKYRADGLNISKMRRALRELF